MTLLSIMASDSDVGMSELQFQFGLSPDVQFSVKLNKLFIQRLETLTVKFKRLDLGTSPDRIKAHLSFSDYNDKLVQTCYAHKTSMKDFSEHVLQCLNSEAMHVKPPKCKQFSCFCPLSWSQDFVWSEAHLFRALLMKEAEPPPEIESASEAEPPPETETGSASEAEPPPDMEAESASEAVPPPETEAESASEAEPPTEVEGHSEDIFSSGSEYLPSPKTGVSTRKRSRKKDQAEVDPTPPVDDQEIDYRYTDFGFEQPQDFCVSIPDELEKASGQESPGSGATEVGEGDERGQALPLSYLGLSHWTEALVQPSLDPEVILVDLVKTPALTKIYLASAHGEKLLSVPPEPCRPDGTVGNHGDRKGGHNKDTGRRHVCDVCNKAFNRAGSLNRHKMIHTGENSFVCDVCNKAFNQAGSLKRHKMIHTDEKPFVCDVCSKAFNQACGLKEHKMIHTGEKPYKCPHCDAAFSRSGNLQTHIRMVHARDKPHVCDVCGAAFSVTSDLQTHTKRIHTGEKPCVCSDCGKSFALSGDLIMHRRTHTGEKPYKCQHCPYACTQSGSLKKHVQRRHQ